MTTTTPTKAEELAAIRELAARLGPDSYLGPWLLDALHYLAAEIRADIRPTSPAEMYQQAAQWRIDAAAACRAMQQQAREVLDKAQANAGRIEAEAEIKAQQQADRVRERLASAIRKAEHEVWA